MLKYFKEGQTSTKRQWAADLGEKALKIIGNSASRYIKASLKEGEERKRRKRERRKRRGKRKWGEQQTE